jgi:hypothetical protein
MNPYEMSPEDSMLFTHMDDMRDDLLEKMTRLERAAIFQDFDDFKYQWHKEQGEALHESL